MIVLLGGWGAKFSVAFHLGGAQLKMIIIETVKCDRIFGVESDAFILGQSIPNEREKRSNRLTKEHDLQFVFLSIYLFFVCNSSSTRNAMGHIPFRGYSQTHTRLCVRAATIISFAHDTNKIAMLLLNNGRMMTLPYGSWKLSGGKREDKKQLANYDFLIGNIN